MLSSDRVEPQGRRRRRKARRNAAMPRAAAASGHEPGDSEAAEALTRLYESDEGQLHKPHDGGRPTHAGTRAELAAGSEPGADDRAWLETHLSDLAERLQVSLARLDPEASLAGLSSRLEAIEERFGRALERVALRADVHSLHSIEAHVLELAGHLEKTRNRMEQIGSLEEEVRGLAQRLDAPDQQQIGVLGKLLRDYIGEWRESEQRTANALHSLEEAIGRLGDTVDAMEASKPAPDLSFATLAVPDPARGRTGSDPLAQGPAGTKSYHSTLDAADYAPKTPPEEAPGAGDAAPARGRRRLLALPGAAIAWSTTPVEAAGAGAETAEPASRVSGVMAVRAKLRRSAALPGEEDAGADGTPVLPGPGAEPAEPARGRRTRPGLLLLAGIALLAGGALLLVHALKAAATTQRVIPERSEPGRQPPITKPGTKQGAKPGPEHGLVDPAPRPEDRKDDAAG
jgi:hypothetical protein